MTCVAGRFAAGSGPGASAFAALLCPLFFAFFAGFFAFSACFSAAFLLHWACSFGGLAVVASVALVGSRSLPPAFAPLVGRVVRSVLSSGRSVASGCAAGADSFARSSCVSAGAVPLVFCAGAALPGLPAGACRAFAGGPLSLPLPARLARRSLALVSFVAASGPGAALVAFLGAPPSAGSGSWLAVRAAVSAGLQVVVFCCGFAPAALPSLAGGSWASAGPGLWSGAVRWVPPPSLF